MPSLPSLGLFNANFYLYFEHLRTFIVLASAKLHICIVYSADESKRILLYQFIFDFNYQILLLRNLTNPKVNGKCKINKTRWYWHRRALIAEWPAFTKIGWPSYSNGLKLWAVWLINRSQCWAFRDWETSVFESQIENLIKKDLNKFRINFENKTIYWKYFDK